MTRHERASPQRARLAYEAARIMIEQGLSDFERARRKAAERLGIADRRLWPTPAAVQEAVLAQRRLTASAAQRQTHRELLQAAREAMRVFAGFEPRLIGGALTGGGDRRAGVELLLFAEQPEEVLFVLMERRIPWREGERRCQYADGARLRHPVLRFMAGAIPFALLVLPRRARRALPLDPVSERPYQGAALADVERWLAESAPGASNA